MSIVAFDRVSEKYRIKFIREGKVSWEEVWALKDVSFSLEKGEVLGVIGENGSGKTTLLKVIAGMLVADKGEVRVDGKVSALMELGAGFNPEFTGKENIALNARMYGIEGDVLGRQLEKAVAFADIGKFIDAPVRYYSLGMYMRLAFALAVFVDPDVLLIDDVLAVGDEEAQLKCRNKIFELKKQGKTLVVVSHDMNMIRQLCDRVILLKEGSVIREGAPDTVISYYLETVGKKEGVAVMEEGPLRLTFNNGNIVLRSQGKLLAQPHGVYLAFFLPSINAWASSPNLSWQIKERSSQRIVAQGRSAGDAFMLEWHLELENGELKTRAKLQGEGFREPHVDLIFIPQYSRWLTLKEEGGFPHFAQKDQWQNLALKDYPAGLLGIFGDEAEGLPYLLLKKGDPGSRLEVLNTGYGQEGRVVQIFSGPEGVVSFNLKFFMDKENFYQTVEKAKEDLSGEDQARYSIFSGDLRLFVDEKMKTIRLFYAEDEMTGPGGLYSAFCASQKWHHSHEAEWGTKKINEKEMTLDLTFPALGLTQTWRFIFSRKNVLAFEVDGAAEKPLAVSNQDMRLELADIYQTWLTPFEEGSLAIRQGFEDAYPVRWKNNKVSQVVLRADDKSGRPPFSFTNLSQEGESLTNLHKRRQAKSEFVCLNSSRIIPKTEEALAPGRHAYFKGEISCIRDFRLKKDTYGQIIELNQGSLRFVFDNGRGRIFAGPKELTSGLSIYTSLRSARIWLDSSQALWRIDEKKDKKIVVTGYWPYLPVSQKWQIELQDARSIAWSVETEVHEEAVLEIEQANLMLSDGYCDWSVPAGAGPKGKFSDEFTEDYDILPFRFWYGPADALEAGGDGLPRIAFRSFSPGGFLKGLVENTDSLYRARLLQYQKANAGKLKTGKYPLFKGVIEVAL